MPVHNECRPKNRPNILSCPAPALKATMDRLDSLPRWRPMSCMRSCQGEIWGYGWGLG
jgi:hypothetical protein